MSTQSSGTLMLAMSTPPFWHCGRTVARRSIDYMVALLPALVLSVFTWGIPALRVVALSVAVCVTVEALGCRAMKRRQTVNDLSAVVTGMLFAFLLPASAPWWLVILGAASSILFGKILFGGLGDSPVSAPIVGWAVVFVSYPLFMDPNLTLLDTCYEDPLALLRFLGPDRAGDVSLVDLVLGRQIAALGAGQVGALLVGGCYLLARGVIRLQIVLGMLAGVVIPFALMHALGEAPSVGPAFHLLTGSVLFCAFFVATDSSTAPTHGLAMILYGLTCGVLVFLIRTYGSYADGAPFAVLVTSLLTPYFDMIRPKPFGVR